MIILFLGISSSVAVSAPSNLPQSGVTRVSVYEGGNDMGPEPYGIPLIAQQPQQNLGEDGGCGRGEGAEGVSKEGVDGTNGQNTSCRCTSVI